MPRIEISVDSTLPPEAVLGAATDFTDRRLKIWPNVSPKFYKVHNVTETSADVTEGTSIMGGVWAREIYDWSTPGTVIGTVQESNIFEPGGTWTMTVQPKDGGSHITVVNHRQPKGFKGRMSAAMMSVIGKGFLTKSLNKTLDIVAAERTSAPV